MKHLMILTVGVCLLLSSVPLNAQSEEEKQEVIKADRARAAAANKGDGEDWSQYISDDCIWSNIITGEVWQNKKERIVKHTERGARPPAKLTDEKIHMFEPDRAFQTAHFTGEGEEEPLTGRFMRVWAKREGRWQMIALYYAPESN